MADRAVTDFEFMIMLAVLRVRDQAYGVRIAREIEQIADRPVTPATVYFALNRLRHYGLVSWRLGDPTAQRGGRAKKLFSITPSGLRTVRRMQRAFSALWNGIPELKGS
jgi:PadR family transcriptional regulator PadR